MGPDGARGKDGGKKRPSFPIAWTRSSTIGAQITNHFLKSVQFGNDVAFRFVMSYLEDSLRLIAKAAPLFVEGRVGDRYGDGFQLGKESLCISLTIGILTAEPRELSPSSSHGIFITPVLPQTGMYPYPSPSTSPCFADIEQSIVIVESIDTYVFPKIFHATFGSYFSEQFSSTTWPWPLPINIGRRPEQSVMGDHLRVLRFVRPAQPTWRNVVSIYSSSGSQWRALSLAWRVAMSNSASPWQASSP